MIDRLQAWIELRKKTVIAHWLYGLMCAIVGALFFPAAVVLLLLFALLEWWNDKCEGGLEGCTDWWDAFVVFCVVFSVIVILHLCNLIYIRWW